MSRLVVLNFTQSGFAQGCPTTIAQLPSRGDRNLKWDGFAQAAAFWQQVAAVYAEGDSLNQASVSDRTGSLLNLIATQADRASLR